MNCLKVGFSYGVFLLALSSSPGVWGAKGDSLEAKERAARKACLLGDVKTGTEILADLYLDTKNTTHIYNQARCLEQNGQNAQSILLFREYLRKAPNLSPADSAEVQKRIDDLQAAIDHRAAPTPSTVPSPSASERSGTAAIPPSAAATTGAPASDPLGIAQSAPPPEPQESSPAYKRWWFWSGIGAVVAGGVVTAIVLSSKSAPKSPLCDPGALCVQ
jgi:hypothetical protein